MNIKYPPENSALQNGKRLEEERTEEEITE